MFIWIFSELCLYFYFIYYLNQTIENIILYMFVIDGIIQAYNFIYSWYLYIFNCNCNLNIFECLANLNYEKYSINIIEWIDEKLNFSENIFDYSYKLTIVDKYIYFAVIYLISLTCGVLFWYNLYLTTMLNHILLFMTLPFIYINICKSYYLIFIVSFFKEEIYKLLITIMSNITAYCINQFSFIILNSKPNIDGKELETFYENNVDNVSDSFNKLSKLCKSFVLLSAIHYIKKTNNSLFKTIISVVHSYHINGISLNEISASKMNIEDKKNNLALLIGQRDWQVLLNSKNMNMFFELFEDKKNDSLLLDYIYRIIKLCSLSITKFMSLWSLHTFNFPVWFITSCFFNWQILFDFYKILSIILACGVYIYSRIMASFVIIFADKILLLTYYLAIYLSKKKIMAIIHVKYNIKYIVIPLISYITYQGTHYIIEHRTYDLYILSYLRIIIVLVLMFIFKLIYKFRNNIPSILITSFLIFGYISNYTLMHILIMSYIYNLLINCVSILQQKLNEENIFNVLYLSNYMIQSTHFSKKKFNLLNNTSLVTINEVPNTMSSVITNKPSQQIPNSKQKNINRFNNKKINFYNNYFDK